MKCSKCKLKTGGAFFKKKPLCGTCWNSRFPRKKDWYDYLIKKYSSLQNS